MELVLIVITVIGLYASYEIMIHNKIRKENERNNNRSFKKSYNKKKKPSGSTKVSKVKTQNKRKPGRSKKQIKK